MTDIAEDIRKAVNTGRDEARASYAAQTQPPTALKHMAGNPDESFMKLRAHVRGTLIGAWRELVRDGEWLVIDDRILDSVTAWLESKRK